MNKKLFIIIIFMILQGCMPSQYECPLKSEYGICKSQMNAYEDSFLTKSENEEEFFLSKTSYSADAGNPPIEVIGEKNLKDFAINNENKYSVPMHKTWISTYSDREKNIIQAHYVYWL